MAYNKGFYGKRNKFGAKKTEFMGMKFDSKWEAERYGQLYQKICAYVADYTYYETDENGERQYIVEDAKGVETPEFKLKKKLMLAANGIDIRISKK